MTSVIVARLENGSLGNEANQKNTMGSLDHIQERPIHTNLVRRNRIYFATQDMRAAVEKRQKEKQERLHAAAADKVEGRPAPSAQVPDRPEKTGSAEPDLKESKPMRSHSIPAPQDPSIGAPSEGRTATDIPSAFKLKPTTSKKAPTIMTTATRIGDRQDYPSCPKRPRSGELLPCPYCAEPLNADYEKNVSGWR
jgi:hypothetical protein